MVRICSCPTTSYRRPAPIDSFIHLIKCQPSPSVTLKRWITTGLGWAMDGAASYTYTDAEKREIADNPGPTFSMTSSTVLEISWNSQPRRSVRGTATSTCHGATRQEFFGWGRVGIGGVRRDGEKIPCPLKEGERVALRLILSRNRAKKLTRCRGSFCHDN